MIHEEIPVKNIGLDERNIRGRITEMGKKCHQHIQDKFRERGMSEKTIKINNEKES